MQRGYQVTTEGEVDYCVMPDGSKCVLEDFNAQTCGQNFFSQDYCIEEGEYVWDAEKCCRGLVAYLPEGMAGQARCEKAANIHLKSLKNSSWPLGILLAILVGLGMFLFKRFKSKKS